MSPRTGRPKTESPKLQDIKVRVDKEMLRRLDEYCKETGDTRAGVIRKGINLLLNQK